MRCRVIIGDHSSHRLRRAHVPDIPRRLEVVDEANQCSAEDRVVEVGAE